VTTVPDAWRGTLSGGMSDESAFRVYLNPHVDLELTGEAAQAYAAADEVGRQDMAHRLLAEHLELAVAGSGIMTVQALRVEEIGDLIRRRIGRAAGVSEVDIGGDLDHVRIGIHAARPGVVHGHGGAEIGRLRAELEELTGKPVVLNMVDSP
jgi:hypothetical protein